LRSFLLHTLSDTSLLARLNWNDYKRNIVGTLVGHLARHEDRYQRELIRLMTEVAQINDFSHLRRLEDGKDKEQRAQESVGALRELLKGHRELQQEEEEIERRREETHKRLLQVQAVREKLQEINHEFFRLLSDSEPQKRGFRLEKVLRDLFDLFDLDPKASFRITGEQIGFSEEAVKVISSGRRLIILMDGSDLMAVFEGRIDLVQLLLRKRRKAAETGNIYLRIHEIL
jgi:hypothetical protein